jgi:peptidylprolyl isomerase
VIRTRTATALFLSAALALTACGDDDDAVTADSAANNAGAYSAPAVTANATDLATEPKSGAGSGAVTALQTKDLVVGKGKAAKLTDTVTVHYVGSLFSDGSVFDSSWGGQPAVFPLNRVVPGFAQGIEGMQVGGRRQIVIPSDLGYGPRSQPGIPANSVLVFIVDLKAIG